MTDPFSSTLEDVRKEVGGSGMRIFYGYLAEENHIPAVHWNRENGGNWKKFVSFAVTLDVKVLYLNWAPFEQFEIDDAVSKLESKLTQDEDEVTKGALNRVRGFQSKVGMTCVIDLAFVANGVVHVCQETTDWYDEFCDLSVHDDEEDDETEETSPANKIVVDKWATALAGDPKYLTSKQHEFLLEKLAGEEFEKLPIYEILRRAETIFQVDFKQAAEEKLAAEIRQLREEGTNINAIAIKLGVSRDRVSGLLPSRSVKK